MAASCRGYFHRDKLDIPAARDILNADHYDLEKVKKRILEYLAVRKLKTDKKGHPLSGGPPGVGKTSLGKSSRAPWGASSCACRWWVRDEAEIRGHRRTYVGRCPANRARHEEGGIEQPCSCSTRSTAGARLPRDPAAALLEVLDPEQNHAFSDHYLRYRSICPRSCSSPRPTFSTRCRGATRSPRVLEIPGYTSEEKLNIAKQFLIKKQLDEHGLAVSAWSSKIPRLWRSSTATPRGGVRNLEPNCQRHSGVAVLGRKKRRRKETITMARVPDFLGPQKYLPEVPSDR